MSFGSSRTATRGTMDAVGEWPCRPGDGRASETLGTVSRGHFMARARRQLAQDDRNALVVLVMLDRLLRVSFHHGWGAGDQLAQQAGVRIREHLGDGVLLGRLGEEIFGLLVPGIAGRDQAVLQLEALTRAFAAPFHVDGHPVYLTVAMGASLSPAEGTDVRELLLKAERAMVQARRVGRSKWCLHEACSHVPIEEEPSLEADLGQAIARGELTLHYQPYVDIAAGRPVGAEALLRWCHPRLGLLAPDCFVQLAEEAGLIDDIGTWVLHAACHQARTWRQRGIPHLSVAVNVSAAQFNKGNLVSAVASALAASGLEPQALELEITESTVMHDVQAAIGTLRKLKDMGVVLSVDDFGTGYSSLSYLKRFPLDSLKVDRSFVQDIGVDPDHESIVRAIINLAKTLKLKVTAEGVESTEQLRFLLHEGCDRVQGYLFGRPVTSEGLEHLVKQRSLWWTETL